MHWKALGVGEVYTYIYTSTKSYQYIIKTQSKK